MNYFPPQHIVRATELRRHLGEYLVQAEDHPILIIDRSSQKKVLMNADILDTLKSPARKKVSHDDLKNLIGLFGKSKISSVKLQHQAFSSWYKKYS